MIKDHTKTSNELKSLMKQGDAQKALPSQLDDKHTQMLNQLKSASGANFDRSYKQMQVQAHEDAVNLVSPIRRRATMPHCAHGPEDASRFAAASAACSEPANHSTDRRPPKVPRTASLRRCLAPAFYGVSHVLTATHDLTAATRHR